MPNATNGSKLSRADRTFVRVAVTELEAYGTLVVELERIEGPVIVRWTDEQGKTQEVRLTHKET